MTPEERIARDQATCVTKIRYVTREAAEIAASRVATRKETTPWRKRASRRKKIKPTNIYQCPIVDVFGPHFHLTKREQTT